MDRMEDNLRYWLWVTMAFGAANPRKWKALSFYESPSKLYEAVSSNDMGNISSQDLKSVSSLKMDRVDELYELCQKRDIRIICPGDSEYPERLFEIYNPPSALFARGRLSQGLDSLILASAGTRKPSKYSVKVTAQLVRELTLAGFVMSTGMAVGLDSVVIRAAIASGGEVVVPLPCGLDYDGYPREVSSKENRSAKELIAARGMIISEYLPNEGPSRLSFVARNRLLSGISVGALITQAGAGSGALSTASFAVSQGRDVFCIPPHMLYDSSYEGVSNLIRDGAIPVFGAEDVVNAYYSSYPHKLKRPEGGVVSRSERLRDSSVSKKPRKTAESENTPSKKEKKSVDLLGLSEEKRRIAELILENGSMLFDDLSNALGGELDLGGLLTELEIEGVVRMLPGNRYTVQS